jgi:integrase/recombinase XerD
MRYELDFMNSFEKTLLFWIERFVRNKLTTLSNRQVTDKNKLAMMIQNILANPLSLKYTTTITIGPYRKNFR